MTNEPEWVENIKNWVDCAIDAGYEIPETAVSALNSIIQSTIKEEKEKAKAELLNKIEEEVKGMKVSGTQEWKEPFNDALDRVAESLSKYKVVESSK